MARTTSNDVLDIMTSDLTASDVDPFVTMAHEMVEELVAVEDSVSESMLEELERLLGAHFTTVLDPRVSSGGEGDSTISFEGSTGEDIRASRYGNAAIALDPTGNVERGYATYTLPAGPVEDE